MLFFLKMYVLHCSVATQLERGGYIIITLLQICRVCQ